MEQFAQTFSTTYNLPLAVARRLLSAAVELTLRQGDNLVTMGEQKDTLFVLRQGIVRAYVPDESIGATQWFAFAGEMVVNMHCYYAHMPSAITIEASTPCHLLAIDKPSIEHLCATDLDMANAVRRMFERHAFVYENNVGALLGSTDAMQRYLTLLRRHPELIRSVPLNKLASYLMVTPQSLSRIRANLKL